MGPEIEKDVDEKWETSVKQLISIFRMALLALLPSLEQARIPWREPDAYDNWDEISESLYKNIVVSSVKWALPNEEMENLELPKYDILYPTYSKMSFIEVLGSTACPHLVFHSFITATHPLDTLKCRCVDNRGNVIKEAFETIPFDQADFQVLLRVSPKKFRPIKELSVLL